MGGFAPSFFDGFDPEARAVLNREAERLRLHAGGVLFRQGDAADALYVVLSGSLSVLVANQERGGAAPPRLINQIYAGQTVGEMGLLSDHPRSATVVASRDTTLLRITKEMFSRLVPMHPGATLRLSAQLVERLEMATQHRDFAAAPRTVALLPVHPGISPAWLADAFVAAVSHAGIPACVIPEPRDESVLDRLEAAHDLAIYVGRANDPAWTETAAGRSDRVLLVAAPERGDAAPGAWRGGTAPWRSPDLVVLHRADAAPGETADLLRRLPVRSHWHVREGNAADVGRLARHVLGRTVGVVFSGGGARGYAHLGVIRALRELEIPLDCVGGASFGAIVAAAAACEWDDAELLRRFRESFARSNPLNDYALPIVALTRGGKVLHHLRAHFGSRRIEDLSRPFFAVAANLTRGSMSVLKEGPVWEALRASIALPGVLPPWIADGEVLVDGAVMNNLPADVMRETHGGVVIAADVTRFETLVAPPSRGFLWRLLSGESYGGPGIFTTLLRSAHVGSDLQTRLSRAAADVMLEPPLPDIDLRDWQAIDRAVESGYRYAMGRADELQRAAFPSSASIRGNGA
jgi:NTE family protein